MLEMESTLEIHNHRNEIRKCEVYKLHKRGSQGRSWITLKDKNSFNN